MATQQIEFEAASGLTLVARLFLAGSDTIVYTASSVTEQTNRKGIYRATFSNVSDNTYQLIATSSGVNAAVCWGYVKNANRTYQFYRRIFPSPVFSEVGIVPPISDLCGTNLRAFYGETRTYTIDVSDANGNPYDFSGLNLVVCIERDTGTNLELIQDSLITISGNTVEFETSVSNNSIGQHRWSLRRTDTDAVILFGDYIVRRAALA
jgi:hypothetical protein